MRPLTLRVTAEPLTPTLRVVIPLTPTLKVVIYFAPTLELPPGLGLVPAGLPLVLSMATVSVVLSPGLLDTNSPVEIATGSSFQPITVGTMLACWNSRGIFSCVS